MKDSSAKRGTSEGDPSQSSARISRVFARKTSGRRRWQKARENYHKMMSQLKTLKENLPKGEVMAHMTLNVDLQVCSSHLVTEEEVAGGRYLPSCQLKRWGY